MNGFLNDLRFGLRQLATKPGFAAAAIITLALGIGANTAVFSVLNGYLLKPLPYPHGDKLVDISESFPGAHADIVGVSVMNYREFKRDLVALAGIAAYARKDYNLTVDGRTQRITALRARSALFDVLEAKPYLGHVFNRANDQQGRGNVAVLSYGFWQQTFGGDRSVIGRSIKLDGRPYRIIGVMPRGWNFPDKRASLFVPYVFTPFLLHLTRESGFPFHVIGRTKRGASIHTVAMELAQFKSRVEREASASLQAVYKKYHWQLNVLPYKHIAVGDRAPLLWILQGFVLLVLLMACANVANLLLARILGRSHEIAMRAALGASRVALVRQQFAEGLCVAIPGGVIGVAIGWLAVTFIDRAGIGEQLALFDLSPDWRVGLFALGVVIAVAIGISVLPIRQLSRNDLQSLLQASGRTAGSSHSARRMRNGLVVAEIALAAALLGGTGLLVNSFLRLQSVHPGF
ncbi:MAG TPA: ABC transporter permease, partial [Gammaproteobacteria bacterium]|nr:ABC transporter permease [Gammaproteobacteria bacterium]